MIERWYQSLKYEHLLLHEIDDGPQLAQHVLEYSRVPNDERPHEANRRRARLKKGTEMVPT